MQIGQAIATPSLLESSLLLAEILTSSLPLSLLSSWQIQIHSYFNITLPLLRPQRTSTAYNMESTSSPSSPNRCSHESSLGMGTASTKDLHVRDPPDERPKVSQSPLHPRRGTRSSEQLQTTKPRRRSGTGTSRPPGSRLSVSGTPSRERDDPLPHINVEAITNPVAKKRARNTLAARNCRKRKNQRVRELDERIARLEAERDYWKGIALEGIWDNNGE